mgnify:CR=1 FL=1
MDGLAFHAKQVQYYRYASEKGHPKAQHNLASLYEHGVGVTKDDVEVSERHRDGSQ